MLKLLFGQRFPGHHKTRRVRRGTRRQHGIETLERRLALATDINLSATPFVLDITGSAGTAIAQRVAVDANGNTLVAGTFTGTVDLDPRAAQTLLTSAGSNDVFVAKYSAANELLWARRFGGSGDDRTSALAVNASGTVYFGGRYEQTASFDPSVSTASLTSSGDPDAFIGSLDASGMPLWIDAYGGVGFCEINALGIQPDGNLVATGSLVTVVDFDRGPGVSLLDAGDMNDVFVLNLAPTGAFRWVRQFGAYGYQYPSDAAVASDGSIFVTGSFYGTVDFDPGPGTRNLKATDGYTSAFIVKLDAAGNLSWVGNLSGVWQSGESIAVDSTGAVYVAGVAYGTTDFDLSSGTAYKSYGGWRGYLAKYDAAGSYLWARSIADSYNYSSYLGTLPVYDIAVDLAGWVYSVGGFTGMVDFDERSATKTATSSGDQDAYLLKWNAANGDLQSVKTYGGSGRDRAENVLVDAFGRLAVVGSYASTVEFGATPGAATRTSLGSSAGFVAFLGNSAPSAIALSANSVTENQPVGTTVGTLSTTDPDAGDTFSYTLVTGPGSNDNASFTIVGDQLSTAASFDYETKSSYSIRVRSIDAGGLSVEKAFTILVSDFVVAVDMVPVGDPRNANDSTGYGAVDYEYRIGKFEITIGQYAEFLNAVAKSDPYSLYDPSMATDWNVAGISRSGESGSYVYSVIGPFGVSPTGADSTSNRPITYVSWFDAARFANWMHNGQGNGSTETGSYTMVEGQTSGTAPARNPNATIYIPTENEWYKAAYYSPLLNSGSGGYWTYATQSNTAPGNNIGVSQNEANYYVDGHTVTQSVVYSPSQNYLSNVGAFAISTSYYRTFDLDGNVQEWNDLSGLGDITWSGQSVRGIRGGDWGGGYGLAASHRYVTPGLWFGTNGTGFRLASPVPNQEPSDISLSRNTLPENAGANAVVGTLSTTDPDAGNTFTYTLVTGTGSTDNDSFSIVGNQLKTTVSFNYEAKSDHSIRVRSTDAGGLTTEKQFTISVTDIPETFGSGSWGWAGAVVPDNTIVTSVVSDSVGDVYVSGHFSGNPDFDMGPGKSILSSTMADGFVAKYSSTGSIQWVAKIGGSQEEYPTGITIDASGNVLVCGYFSGAATFGTGLGTTSSKSSNGYDGFIFKLNSAGQSQWVSTFSGTFGCYLGPIATDSSGSAIVVGTFSGDTINLYSSAGTTNLTAAMGNSVVKLDASGTLSWVANFTGGRPSDVTTDAEGNILATGTYQYTVDFDPSAATATLTSGHQAAYTVKLSASGGYLWARSLANSDWAHLPHAAFDSNGNALVAGQFEGTIDFDATTAVDSRTAQGSSWDAFVTKFSSDGDYQWTRQISGTNEESIDALATNSGGDVFLVGKFAGQVDADPGTGVVTLTSAGNTDVMIVQLSALGDYRTATRYGGTAGDSAKDVSVDATGARIIVGQFNESIVATPVEFGPQIGDASLVGGDRPAFVLTLINHAPTDIALSATSVAESALVYSTVGTLTTIDDDAGDSFSYSLVAGMGSTDNASFTIDGNALKTATAFDYETQKTYSLRIRSTDAGGLTSDKTFTLSINDSSEDFSYTAANGEVTLTGYTGTSDSPVIPSAIAGMPVTTIGVGAFSNRTDLRNITIPDSVTSIASGAFYNCIGLADIWIPASVTSLSSSAFGRDTYLPPESRFAAINVDAGNPNYCSVDGVLYNKPLSTLLVVPTAKPGRIEIPASVTAIYSYGDRLDEFAVDPNNTTFCSIDGVLYDKAVTVLIKVPSARPGVVTIPATVVWLGYVGKTTGIDPISGLWFATAFVVEPGNTVFTAVDGILYDKAVTRLVMCPGGKVGDVVIPSTVTTVDNYTFRRTSQLTSVTFPATITTLGSLMFYRSTGATRLYFLGDAPTVSSDFRECPLFTAYYLTNASGWTTSFHGLPATSVNYQTGDFRWSIANGGVTITRYTGSAVEVRIPDTIFGLPVTSIGDSAFYACVGMTSIIMPAGMVSIGSRAFDGCTGLLSITIPASVTSIGDNPFIGCSGLIVINAESGSTSYKTVGGMLLSADGTTLVTRLAATPGIIAVPAGVTNIGSYAFFGLSALTSIVIPAGVTRIGDNPFANCNSLTEIAVESGNSQYRTDDGILLTADGKTVVACPARKSGVVTIPESVTSIASYAFYSCSSLTSITIPAGVTSIADWAFYRCSGLASITVPEGVTSIGERAFSRCRGLDSFTIPASVTSIGNGAFFQCSSLAGITIPAGVKKMGDNPFAGCSSLAQIFLEPGTSSFTIDNGLLLTADGKTLVACPTGQTGSITIPAGVTSIGGYAFYSCSGLTSVTLPVGVASIGNYAFSGCGALTSITLPHGVASIGSSAFSNCSNLTIITIPASVTSIGYSPFSGCGSLSTIDVESGGVSYKTVDAMLLTADGKTLVACPAGKRGALTIPVGVTSIASYAFAYCSGLTSITLPAGLTIIGSSAFSWCSGLTSVTVPAGVTSIGSSAFSGCSGLTSIAIPTGVVSIGNLAFAYCYGLTSVTVPAGVKSIGSSAFSGCSVLTSVTIPASVLSIGDSPFVGCRSLTTINVESGGFSYKTVDGVLLTADGTTLVACPAGQVGALAIPPGVTSIGNSAFSGCSGLTSITMPAGVTSIGSSAFSGCSGLTSITLPVGVTSIGNSAFTGCSGLTSITLPKGVTSIGSSAFSGCSGLTSITLPEGVTSIGSSAFSGCSGLASITLPVSVTTIGSSAFSGCSVLTSVTIPASVLSIGDSPFVGCTSLTTINVESGGFSYKTVDGVLLTADGTTLVACPAGQVGALAIPPGVTNIGNSAFSGCSGLTSITMPAGVTSIGSSAFSGCSGLTSITLPVGVTSIGSDAFAGCSGLTSITLPAGVTSIGSGAFNSCSGLTSITIPAGVTSIGYAAFYNCSGLSSITIPASVTSMGDTPFWGCWNLTTINVDSGSFSYKTVDGILFTADGKTLVACPARKRGALTIPVGVTSISTYAFYNCTDLTSITIPVGVTSIGQNAFYNCSGLTNVVIPVGATRIGWGAFADCSGLTSITIPASVTSIESYAFTGCNRLTTVHFGGPPPASSGYNGFYGISAVGYYNDNFGWESVVFPGLTLQAASPPSDIILSAASVAENAPAGTAVGTLSAADVDANDAHTYSLVSGTDSIDNSSFTIVGNTLKTAAVFNYESKSSYSVRIRATDQCGSYTEKTFAIAVTGVAELRVDSLTPNASGFTVALNRGIVSADLNLYDQSGVLGAADVTLVGAKTGAVKGSLVVAADGSALTFVRTGSVLPTDSYTVTLRSASTGFHTVDGELLDGNGDGTPGGDYTTTFVVTQPADAIIVGVADFARGAGQTVNVPATGAGLPLVISSGQNVSGLDFVLAYDPTLLSVTDFVLAPSLVNAGVQVSVNTTTAGSAAISIFSTTSLSAVVGSLTVGHFVARVPQNAAYSAKEVLDIQSLVVYDNASGVPGVRSSLDDDAIHVAAYFGDLSANRLIQANDAILAARITTSLNTGLSGYQMADPMIVADISSNGRIQSNDAIAVARYAAGTSVAEIPTIPTGFSAPATGLDPILKIGSISGAPGATITVPVTVEIPSGEPAQAFSGFDLAMAFDAAKLTFVSIASTSFTTGFTVTPNTGVASGILTVSAFTSGQTATIDSTSGARVLANITFTINTAVPTGNTTVNLLADYASQRFTALFDSNTNEAILNPAPTNASTDSVDGVVAIQASNQAPTDIALAATAVAENAPVGTTVGTLSTIDADAGDSFTYTLVTGTGSTDNGFFAIDGGILKTAASFNYEAKSNYSIRVRSTNAGGLAFDKQFAVSVLDLPEPIAQPIATVPNVFSVVEDQATGLVFTGTPFTDADSPATRVMTVTLKVADGTIAARSADGVVVGGKATARTFSGTITALNAYFTAAPARITYTPVANSTKARRITTTISEPNGLRTLSSTATSTIEVTAVDDAPIVSAPGLFTVKEDIRGNLAWPAQGVPFAEIDSSSLTVTLSVPDGAISAASTAAVAVRGTATARSFSGTTTALNAYFRKLGSIGYTPAPNSTAARTLTTTVSDGNLSASKVSTIRITPVNDAPTVYAAASLTGGRPGIPYEITYESLKTAANVADIETANPRILIQAINSGSLQKWNGTVWAAVSAAANAPLSQKLLSAGQKLRWLPPANAVGNQPAFKIKASDGAMTSGMTSQVFVSLQDS